MLLPDITAAMHAGLISPHLKPRHSLAKAAHREQSTLHSCIKLELAAVTHNVLTTLAPIPHRRAARCHTVVPPPSSSPPFPLPIHNDDGGTPVLDGQEPGQRARDALRQRVADARALVLAAALGVHQLGIQALPQF